MKAWTVAAFLAAHLGAACAQTAPPPTTVHVTGGDIIGKQDGGINAWLGIPYAAPPVGPLRWRSPQPVVPWTGVKEARAFGPACAQTADWVPEPKREDCLYLNVWAGKAAAKAPVMVWIHGGGYYGGTAAQPVFDGASLARHGVVVVTINYRLGVFGFFAHPELVAESPDHAAGNQGIEDQIAALRWVKRNIAAFGGDPERVTVFGESAGGESVAILVASPLAKGLFQRAIAESGNDAMPIAANENAAFDSATAQKEASAFAQAAGAPRLADLRDLDVKALHKQPWSPHPIVDGHVLLEDLTTTYRLHHQNDVPLLVGWNAEEGKDLAPELLGTDDFTAARYVPLVTKLLGHAPSPGMLAAYPATTDAQARASINQLTNDWWGWRMWYWAGLQATFGKARSYVYYYAHAPAPPASPCGYGCGIGHGVEIQYVFDHLDLDRRAWTPQDRGLAVRLATTWANFARTGSPNGLHLPRWAPFDGSPETILRIGDDADLRAHGKLPEFSLFPSVPGR